MSCSTAHSLTALAVLTTLVNAIPTAAQSPAFRPGDRVECDFTQTGRYESGTVAPFDRLDLDQSGRWYRVKLDKDKIPNSTVECMANRLRRSAAPPPAATQTTPAIPSAGPAGKSPSLAEPRKSPPTEAPAAKTMPRTLPGTAWKIDFGRGVTGTIFLFCRSGRWEIVPAGGSIGAVGKSYEVSGTTLTTVNRDDGKVERYGMTWKPDVLELNDGRTTMRLRYNGETQCK